MLNDSSSAVIREAYTTRRDGIITIMLGTPYILLQEIDVNIHGLYFFHVDKAQRIVLLSSCSEESKLESDG
jgi:hypothetical protein